MSFLIAPRYFYEKGFTSIAEQQRAKPFDFTKVNGAEDKDISLQQLVGPWIEPAPLVWRFHTNGFLVHGANQYVVLGNRLISDGHTMWKMVLKDDILELWTVEYQTLFLGHKLKRANDRKPK